MFSLASVTLLLSVASTLAIPSHQLRNVDHSGLAKRVDVSLSKRASFTANRVTWYPTNTGADACTGKNHKDSDNIVALNIPQWGNLNSRSKNCGRKIRITANGITEIGVIQDACGTCYNEGEIDLTKGLFQKFASLDKGVFKATWSFVDDDDEEPEQPEKPKTTKKPSAPTKPTTTKSTKSTPTPEKTPEKDETKKPSPTPTPEKATTTKKETQPTGNPHTGDDDDTEDDDDEECEEYEDDEDDEDTSGDDKKDNEGTSGDDKKDNEGTHGDNDDHKEHKEEAAPKPSPKPSPPAKNAAPIKVDSTPSKVNTPAEASSSASSSSTVFFVAPTVPVANPAPEPSASQESNEQSGGISENSLGGQNGALSLSDNKVLMSILTIALIAIQIL